MPEDCRCRRNGLMAKTAVYGSGELELGLYLLGKIFKPDFAERNLLVCSLF